MSNFLPNIDDVLFELDQIIEASIQENNFLGVFAYIYRRTTAQIKEEILNQRFENNDLMEQFDVVFATYYIDAYKAYKANQPISKSWEVSFAAANDNISIIQHLIMGMNAHINYDLGVAAAQVAPNGNIEAMKADFYRVNEILAELCEEIQDRLGRISKVMSFLNFITISQSEKVVDFYICKFRSKAWEFASTLSNTENKEERSTIKMEVDQLTANLGQQIRKPGNFIARMTLKVVRMFEKKNINEIMPLLAAA